MTNSKRDEQEMTTKGGIKVTYKGWLTGREASELQNIYIKGAKMSVVNGQPQIDSFDASVESEATKKLIELLVVSVDGDANDVVNRVLDLRDTEYEEIVATLNALTKKKQ